MKTTLSCVCCLGFVVDFGVNRGINTEVATLVIFSSDNQGDVLVTAGKVREVFVISDLSHDVGRLSLRCFEMG